MRTLKILISVIILSTLSCTQKKAKKSQLTTERKDIYLDKGRIISSLSFGALSSELRKAYEAEGVAGAIKYCSLKAHPIIDSLSKEYNAEIKRTSLLLRNKNNSPTQVEKEMLNYYKSQFEAGEEMLPKVKILENGSVTYCAPIKIITPLCLNCHGKLKETLIEENYKVIKEIYPEDEATGYELNDFRGIWCITFNSEL